VIRLATGHRCLSLSLPSNGRTGCNPPATKAGFTNGWDGDNWQIRVPLPGISGVAKSRWLLTQDVNRVLPLTLTHELTEPKPILRHLAESLKPGGRLVIVDRGPRSGAAESRDAQTEHDELRPDLVETEIRNAGFEIISREDHFIDRPVDDHIWWLLLARKP
jgi:predicted methyltransferase